MNRLEGILRKEIFSQKLIPNLNRHMPKTLFL